MAGVANLCRVAQEHRLTLVHISSDYVFDGTRDLHTEDEGFAPLGVFGQTKAAGDALVGQLARHFVVRSSWVIGDGKNFVRTMMGLSRRVAAGDLPQVTVVDDQLGRLTFTDEMARGILWLLGYREGTTALFEPAPHAAYGTYNLTGSGAVKSWAEIAAAVFDQTCGNGEKVVPVSTADYYASAAGPISPRPVHSALALDKLSSTGFVPADWEESLRAYIASELIE